MKQTKMEIQRALAEDSTVYEYDGIYEDIQQKKAEGHASVLAGRAEKKPKYIQNILRAAELRKKEQEKRMEKKIQKERETEGGAFDDKEAFVTSAYKKKLQERAEEEERERKEAAVEACLDVTKQKDLSGFYRHLLNQAVGEEKMPHCSLRGPGIKGEDLSEKPPNSNQTHKSLEDKTRTRVPGKGEETLAADSDLQTDGSDGEDRAAEGAPESRSGEGKAAGAGCGDHGGGRPKPGPSQRDSRSPSEERRLHAHQAERGDGRRRGKAGQHDEKNHERRLQSHRKDERSRTEGHHRRRQDRDDRQRRKDWEEEEEEEKREQRRGREKREHRAKERDREGDREKGRGREAASREGRDEKPKHGRKCSSGSTAQEGPWAQGGNPSSPEKSPELKHKTSADSGEPLEKPPESLSKFARRSNQETVSSARDRYLARQMARVGTKSYVEKEED
ncbi:nuclear speckle splicing regulatory protein 1 [Python bivittatus]|uniref:Nuclear speckle splicing regulatory protein 1 n=1 Tax=Python bivittatus TaxID=176946 RepID=A0A9F2RCP6_PYTBI|nr:nuclear speckle splicing regulatory protein 1 [Python bivittatus]